MLKNRRALRLAWLWLCGLGWLFSTLAGAAELSGSPFVVDSWNSEEGLPDNEVISVIQTQDGYLWVGTLHGLVRFDGIHFTVFNQNNSPGLNSDRIVYLFEDSQTNLWVGTESSGIALVKDGKIKNFGIASDAGSGKPIYAYEDSATNVWFYTADDHFFRYQNGSLDFHPSIFPMQLFYRARNMLMLGQSGVSWRMQNGSVQKWRESRLENDFGACPWGNAPVSSICEDNNGGLIVGTVGDGIFWYNADGNYRHISKDQGLSSAFVLSLCLDREGNLWAGTDGDGLNRIKRKVFNAPAQFHPWTAQSLAEDGAGGLWTAFNFRGLSYAITNSVQDFGIGSRSNAWSVLVDNRQQVWAGTRDEGLFQFQTDHFQPAPGAEILGPWIYALFQDHLGQLWAGTQNGLAQWNGQSWKMFTTRDGLSGNAVRAIAEDADGNLWVGTENQGLDFFKDGKFTAYQKSENGLPGNDISCLYVDKDGALWVGTFGHGLARFFHGKWTSYSARNGLASDSISYLIEDDENYFWIGSNAGLMRLAKKSLNDFADGNLKMISCRTYGKADGLPTRECSIGAQPAAIRTHDGRLWFPTVKGLVSLKPGEIKTNLQPPLVVIESVRIDGVEQKTNLISSMWLQAVTIPPGNEQLEIHYTGLDFSAPKLVRFKYRMDGHETSWTDAGNERVARYPKLPPGNYRFEVTAENEDGVWNDTDSVLAVTVQPYFWETTWFRAVAIIFILAIVAASVRFISTQKFRRQLRQQASLEKERSRIARDLHDQLGANLTQVALLSEMAVADKNSPADVEDSAQQISETARETTRSLDEIVWAINPANDTLEGLANYAGKYAQDYFALAGLRYRSDLPPQLPAVNIPPEVRHNVFFAFKEAVNNVVKHAQASEAWVRLQLSPDYFTLSIEDNGRGLDLDANAASARNGLKNMRQRMADIHGEFSIAAGANGGTIVRLTVPIIY
jgi:ligand-binding sensor domain-containing protein/signal transduction histidine kinase